MSKGGEGNMVDSKLYFNAKSLASSIEEIRLTNEGKAKAFNVANADMFKRVNVDAFRAIEECYFAQDNGLCGVPVQSMNEEVYGGACEASSPWDLGDSAAVLFPFKHPSWKADSEAFLVESMGSYLITHFGEIAFKRYLKESERLLRRVSLQAA
jgi:hypothetical protein